MNGYIKHFFNKKIVKLPLLFIASLYVFAMTFFYFNQEEFYFHPKTLATDYQYQFDAEFEEINIPVDKKNTLNTLLFKAKNSKGIILYLHGNAGALHNWGMRSKLYTDNNYDVLFVDYRGFGKNKNQLESEKMLHNDMQQVYDLLKTKYQESHIIVLGFSVGSGLAANIAANNSPKLLVLEAPYYSFESLVKKIAPFVPKFLISYKIPTHEYLKKVTCPIAIFHGKDDQLITPEGNSIQLQQLYPDNITLHLIDNCTHNGIYSSDTYFRILQKLLK
ncbi:MAG: alpha/beta fold hydrolase [Flavobacteriaceae bacterium]|nr:alpha/beta fold hydrolase [Flavobacteriaceae bacterium]